MASNDWQLLGNSLLSPNVARGVTAGLTPPAGGGNFVYAMNAISAVPGMVGLYASPQPPNTNFNPLLSGGEITGGVCRERANGRTGYSGMLFIGLQGTDVSDEGYMLGLSDGDPSHLELRKGILSVGLPDEAPGNANTVLRQSSTVFEPGDWVHLRFEMTVNQNGDVVLSCYQNDLNAHGVSSPVWAPIPGIGGPFIDDVTGVNTGTLPLIGGRAGFAGQLNGATRRLLFDHITLAKQV